MTNLKNKLKIFLENSRVPAKIFTILTKPFSSSLRNLPKFSEKIPKSPKKVSVIVPNYNYSRFLDRRIDSILSQSYPIFELIILDDASTDDSDQKIKEKLSKIGNNFKTSYYRNEKNSGKPIAQWQKAFREASGDFVWIAEADDYSDRNFLASVMSAFDDEKVVLSYGNSVAVNEKGDVLSYDFSRHAGKLAKNHWKKSYINDGKNEIRDYLRHRCTIPNVSAVVFRKEKSIPVQKYLEEAKSFTQVGDWYFYLKFISHGKIAFSKPSNNFFRISKSSVTGQSKNSKTHAAEIDWIHEHF